MEAKNAATLSLAAVGGISAAIRCNIPATTSGERAVRKSSTVQRASFQNFRLAAGISAIPAPINTPHPVVSLRIIRDRSIGQCILTTLAPEAGRWRAAAAQIAPCAVVPFSLQNRKRRAGLFLVPFRNRHIGGELFRLLCSPAGLRDVVGSHLFDDGWLRGSTRDHLFKQRSRRQDFETVARERAHEVMENARSGQSVHDRMMKREDNRGAIGCRQDRCSHQRTWKSTERQT